MFPQDNVVALIKLQYFFIAAPPGFRIKMLQWMFFWNSKVFMSNAFWPYGEISEITFYIHFLFLAHTHYCLKNAYANPGYIKNIVVSYPMNLTAETQLYHKIIHSRETQMS